LQEKNKRKATVSDYHILYHQCLYAVTATVIGEYYCLVYGVSPNMSYAESIVLYQATRNILNELFEEFAGKIENQNKDVLELYAGQIEILVFCKIHTAMYNYDIMFYGEITAGTGF
jgi:hypothetical protein